jgi:RHS repeat-associated protein
MTDQRITASYSSRYTFTGKEQDGLTGLQYFGARYYDARISLWYGVDPMAGKYPHVSPYVYCLNNPINAFDPDGNDVILLIWATTPGSYGHAGIAVSNYKTETYRVNENGNYITKTRQVADGTYTYYDLWPSSNVGPKDGPVTGAYQVKNKLADGTLITDASLLGRDVSEGENGKLADGVLKLFSGYQEDTETIADLNSYMKDNPKYDSQNNNCSDFAACGVSEVLDRFKSIIENSSDESTLGKSYTTPNGLYKYTRDKMDGFLGFGKQGEEMRSPQGKVNYKFVEAYIKGMLKSLIE